MTVHNDNNETNRRLGRLEAGQEKADQRLGRLEAGQEKADQRLGRLEAGQEKADQRLDRLETGQEELQAGQEELRAGQEELRAGQDELRAGQDELRAGQDELRTGQTDLRETVSRIERTIQVIRNDIAPLKAGHARTSALRISYRICEDLGLEEVRVLDRSELRAMVGPSNASDIPRNHRHSFIEADAIIEATDASGEIQYVAMEASFTADERDTARAVRNAAYLTRFTGRTGHAVIVSHRIDNRIADAIESGKVRWCRLDAEDLEVD